MKKIFTLIAVATMAMGGANAQTKVMYAWESDFSAANKITYEDGTTIQITGNETKTIANAKAITIDGTSYTTMKVSNGAQNTLTLPAGKTATKVTFYSYVNKGAGGRTSYWKEIQGVEYTAETTPGGELVDFNDVENYQDTPDKREFTLSAPANAITYTQIGEQLCYVVEVELSGTNGIDIINTVNVDSASMYNLAGQKVDKSYKGIVIQNGHKFYNK